MFVHGALCVSYSGRCTLSHALGGRSANRGSCAQPCRLPYTLRDGDGRVLATDQHLLSLRDLDRSAWLSELVELGIGSLKIEGRLKDERYVRNVVGHYRRALDAVLEARGLPRASSGTVSLGFEPDPSRSFHRGSTDHFLSGRQRGVATLRSPKSVGSALGPVRSLRGDWLRLERPVELAPGDGLCFVGADGVFRGTAVQRVVGDEAMVAETAGIAPGVSLFRNRDRGFERAVDGAGTQRRIGVAIALEAGPDGPVLRAEDEDGVEARIALPVGADAPRDPLRAAAVAQAQLGRLGDTELSLEACSIDPGLVPHLRRGAWNELRRALVTALREARDAAFPRAEAPSRPRSAPAPWRSLDFRGNVVNAGARRLLERCGVESIEPGAEAGATTRGRPVMTSRYCIRFELERCPLHQQAERAREPWTLEDPRGRRLELRFDCARCQMEVLGP